MPDKHEVSPSGHVLAEPAGEHRDDPAVDELFRRHHSAVFSYALACSRDTKTAEALTAEAFTRAVRASRSGGTRTTAWRPALLVSVRCAAAEWAGTGRRDGLSPDFVQWYDNVAAGPGTGEERILRLEQESLILQAFRALPERWQTVLWHTAVEEESAGRIGALLNMLPGSVDLLTSRAREGLREAYLAAYHEHGLEEHGHDSGECRRYGSLLEASARRAGRRTNSDLERHLQECGRCRGALAELTELDERLSTMLPAGVLLWGGSAYVAARHADAGTGNREEAPGATPRTEDPAWWVKARSLSIPAAALAGSVVAAFGLILYLLPLTSFSGDDEPGSPPLQVVSRPPETVIKDGPTVTSTATPSPSGTPTDRLGGLPGAEGGFTPLHLRSDLTLGGPQSRQGSVTLARTSGNHDGQPHEPVTFAVSGVTGEYRGGSTRFDLSVDAGTSIGNGQQVRVSYDLTGNGSWDRVETYRYHESDDAPGYEHYTQTRGLKTGATGSFKDLVDGKVKVEVWDAIGPGGSTVGTGDASFVRIPFG
ncbi:RNA polymerase sigma factor [Streptomyces abyssalis]|uniref:RNA polymerase sigma factor n=1 Tax=Streptomyces abyssalis TaxID=933944 RepID=UPI00085C2C50|nr:sigma-70 family RNA polymerase sigma factor [Streptomyces abyssalis]